MLKLLAVARNALVVVSGMLLYDDKVSLLQACGYSVSLLFFVVYNWLQHVEAQSSVWVRPECVMFAQYISWRNVRGRQA